MTADPLAGSARPMRADARRNWERIVAAARDAFSEHGRDAPLDEIARQAGVGAGTLYRHFPKRETLVEAVYRDEIETLSARAFELLDSHEPQVALAEWMKQQIEFVVLKRGLAETLKAAIDKNSEVFAYCHEMLTDAVAALLTRGQEAHSIRSDIQPRDLLRLGHGIAVAAEYSTPEETERLLSVMLSGLRPEAPPAQAAP